MAPGPIQALKTSQLLSSRFRRTTRCFLLWMRVQSRMKPYGQRRNPCWTEGWPTFAPGDRTAKGSISVRPGTRSQGAKGAGCDDDLALQGISEALWFFANCAEPDEGFEADCTDWIAISVANEALAKEFRTDLIEGRVIGADAPPK